MNSQEGKIASKFLQYPSSTVSKSFLKMNLYRWFHNSSEKIKAKRTSFRFLNKKQHAISFSCFNRSFSQKKLVLINQLKDFTNLKRLTFDYYVITSDKKGYAVISKILKGLKNLQDFNLVNYFYDVKIKYGLPFLLKAARTFLNLKKLSISVKGAPDMTDKLCSSIFLKIAQLHQISRLEVSFDGCHKITNQGLVQIGKHIIKLKKLQHIILHFYACKDITDEGLGALCSPIFSMNDLLSLALNFSGCTDLKGHIPINKDAPALATLENLGLNFTWCFNLEDVQVQYLSNEFISNIPNLSNLDLTFVKCDKIIDEGLIALGKSLLLPYSLRSIKIELSWCEKLTDMGIIEFLRCIKELEFLENLQLNFTRCGLLSDDSILYFIEILPNLTSLNSLSLNFSGCQEITNIGIINLVQFLRQTPKKCKLELLFAKCPKVNNAAFEYLENFIYETNAQYNL